MSDMVTVPVDSIGGRIALALSVPCPSCRRKRDQLCRGPNGIYASPCVERVQNAYRQSFGEDMR